MRPEVMLRLPTSAALWMTLFIAATFNCALSSGLAVGAFTVDDPLRPITCADVIDPSRSSTDAARAHTECLLGYRRDLTVAAIRIVGDMALVGLGVYLAQSWQRRRFGVYRRQRAENTLSRMVERLADALGLRKPPQVHIDGRTRATAFVYGTHDDPHMVVGSHLIIAAESADRSMRERVAYVLVHELAHLRNGDLLRYRAAQAQRVTLIAAGALTTAIYVIGGLAGVVLLLRYGLVFVIGALALRLLLREREFYADLRAVTVGNVGPYIEALSQLRHHTAAARRLWPAPLRSLFASHPSPALRRWVIANPTLLARVGASRGLGLGLAAGLLGSSAILVFGGLLPPRFAAQWAVTAAGGVAGAVVGAALAREIWRTIYVDLYADQNLTGNVRAAIGLSAGFILGHIIGIGGFSWPRFTGQAGLAVAAITAGWLLFALWIRLAALVRFDTDREIEAGSYAGITLVGGAVGAWINGVACDVWMRVQAPDRLDAGAGTTALDLDRSFTHAVSQAAGGHIAASAVLVALIMAGWFAAAVGLRVRAIRLAT
jgi:Zn-dependent protease with chaperone function